MSESIKFNTKKLEKLNNPDRVKTMDPDLIWEMLNIKKPQVLVDIGAGTGFYASLFSEKMNQGKIYACDSSEIMIDWMKENLVNKIDSIMPIKSEENSIPLPDSIADLVYLMNVYHELEEPSKMLSEAYRLLKNGGKIATIDWKSQETPEGPSASIRIPKDTVIKDILNAGFINMEDHEILTYHYFITGQKV